MTNGMVVKCNYTTIDLDNGVIRMWWEFPDLDSPKEYRAGKVEESISVSPVPGNPDKCIFHWVVKINPSNDPAEANMERCNEMKPKWEKFYNNFAKRLDNWVKAKYQTVSKESVFIKRPCLGRMANGIVGHMEMTAMMMQTQPDMFKMNADNIVEKRAMIEAYI